MQSRRFCTTIREIFRFTFNIIGNKFPQPVIFRFVYENMEDGLIFRELSAESGRVGSSVYGGMYFNLRETNSNTVIPL